MMLLAPDGGREPVEVFHNIESLVRIARQVVGHTRRHLHRRRLASGCD